MPQCSRPTLAYETKTSVHTHQYNNYETPGPYITFLQGGQPGGKLFKIVESVAV